MVSFGSRLVVEVSARTGMASLALGVVVSGV
jgi:hypothetical protein